MKFPHFIRSQKRRGGSGLRDNHMQWDFWTPEPGVGAPGHLPDGRPRHPEDLAPHERLRLAHLPVDQRGRREALGEVPLPQRPGRRGPDRHARPTRIAGEDADFHRRDLHDAIERGDIPAGRCRSRSMPYEDAKTYRFNPFDLTKMWPHGDYPLIKVGTMTLNRNPENFFAQIEQAAFEPSALGAGHRVLARQDAARPGLRLLRHPPLPDRPELPAAAGQPAHASRSTPTRSTARWPTTTAVTRRSTRRTPSAVAYSDHGRRRWTTAGRPTARMVRRPTRCAPTTTTSARPARWCARCGTTRSATAFVNTVAGHLLGGVKGDVLERAFQYWKNVDAESGKRIEELVRGAVPASQPGRPARGRPGRRERADGRERDPGGRPVTRLIRHVG